MPKRGQVVLLVTFVQGEGGGGGGRSLRLYSHFFPSHCQCHMKWILMYFCFLEGALKCSLRRGLFSSFAGVIDSFSTKQGKRREGGRGGGARPRSHFVIFATASRPWLLFTNSSNSSKLQFNAADKIQRGRLRFAGGKMGSATNP